MRAPMGPFLLFCILFVLSWPLALLAAGLERLVEGLSAAQCAVATDRDQDVDAEGIDKVTPDIVAGNIKIDD